MDAALIFMWGLEADIFLAQGGERGGVVAGEFQFLAQLIIFFCQLFGVFFRGAVGRTAFAGGRGLGLEQFVFLEQIADLFLGVGKFGSIHRGRLGGERFLEFRLEGSVFRLCGLQLGG